MVRKYDIQAGVWLAAEDGSSVDESASTLIAGDELALRLMDVGEDRSDELHASAQTPRALYGLPVTSLIR